MIDDPVYLMATFAAGLVLGALYLERALARPPASAAGPQSLALDSRQCRRADRPAARRLVLGQRRPLGRAAGLPRRLPARPDRGDAPRPRRHPATGGVARIGTGNAHHTRRNRFLAMERRLPQRDDRLHLGRDGAARDRRPADHAAYLRRRTAAPLAEFPRGPGDGHARADPRRQPHGPEAVPAVHRHAVPVHRNVEHPDDRAGFPAADRLAVDDDRARHLRSSRRADLRRRGSRLWRLPAEIHPADILHATV